MRVGFHRTFTALSLYFGVRLFVEKCPEILAMSMNIHIAKKKKAEHQFWLCLVNSVNSVYIISRFDDFITLKIGNSGNSVNSSNFKMSGHTMWLS